MVYNNLGAILQKRSPRIAKLKDLSNFLNNIAGYDITTPKGREEAIWHACNIIVVELDCEKRLPDTLMADLLDPFWLDLLMDIRCAIMTASFDPKSGIAAYKLKLIQLNAILRWEDHLFKREEMEKHLEIEWKE
uniref:Uncharacterized protein n=1 Tax=Panagrellus redivivus TaxID=6233 RepID=A0A7E4VVN3_PANRE